MTETVTSSGKNAENGTTNGVSAEEKLNQKIVAQIEYYFGNYNLPRDKFLKEEIKKDDGWIPMETLMKFKRLLQLTTDPAKVISCLKSCGNDLMQVHESEDKIRRNPDKPLPFFDDNLKAETAKRTIYLKGFPKQGTTLDMLLEHFKGYGPLETIFMRNYSDKENKIGFKGSILIVFPTVEKAKEFIEIGEVKYNDVPLIRKYYEDYLAEKKAEIDERRAKKEARQKENAVEIAENCVAFPEGVLLHMSGLVKEIAREDIKGQIAKVSEDLAFVDYTMGLTEGYLRFSKPEVHKGVLEKLEGKLKIGETEISLRLVEGEEEKEQLARMNEERAKVMLNRSRKRKGGGNNRGGKWKRQRH